MNGRKPVTVALMLVWAVLLLARAMPSWIPDFPAMAAMAGTFFKINSPDAGLVYAVLHHSEMLAKVALLELVLLFSGTPVVRWLTPPRRAGRQVSPADAPRRDRLVEWGIGFGAASLATLGWGLTGLWYPGPVLFSTALLALPAAVAGGAWRRPAAGAGRASAPPASPAAVLREGFAALPPWHEIPLTAYAGAAAILILACLAIAPDSSWDAVVYHLRVPAFFVSEHRAFYIPTHHFTAFPLATEMLYGWLMLLGGLERMGGGEAAKLFHLSCAVVCGLAARRLALRLLDVPGGLRDIYPAGWLAFTLVLAGQFTGSIGVRAYNDFVPAALVGVALSVLVEGASGAQVIAAALLGVALSAKYTVVMAFACLAPLWFRLNPAPYLVAAVPLVPWILKNALFTGNPAAPFLSSVFPSGGPESAFQLRSYAASVGQMSFSPASLGRSAVLLLGGRGDDSLTELLGVLVVPAFLLPGFGALDGRLGLFLAGFTALWMVISPDLRFFSSGFSVYAALAAAGYARAERAFGLRLKPVLIALLALNLVRMPIVHLRLFDPLPFTFGRETAWDNISRAMYPAPHYGRMVWWANRDLPENARLLVVIDIKAHYLWRRVYHDFQYVQPGLFLRWMRAAGSIPGFMKKLEQEGITHVLVVRQRTRGVGSHYAWRGGELAMAAEFFASHTLPVAKSEWVEVLKVERPPQPRRPLDGYEWILFTYPENELIVEHDAAILPMLEETARRAPWLKGVKGYLGIAYGRANRPAEAAAMLREAVREGGPTAAHSAFVLGQVMRMKGDVKAAELWWRTALRLDPNHADAHYNLAGVLYERGARREALTEAAAAAKLAPDKAEYAKARAEIARSLGAP